MNIDRVYSRNIIHAQRSCSLQRAADLMRQHHVGALLVTEDEPDEERAIGIVTDRDLVLQAMAQGIGPREATLSEVMTHPLATVSHSADIHVAMEIMRNKGVRRLAVTGRDGMLVGIVSFDDIVDGLAAELASLTGIVRTEREREVLSRGEGSTPIM